MSNIIWYHLVFEYVKPGGPLDTGTPPLIHSALSETIAPSPIKGINFFLPFLTPVGRLDRVSPAPQTLIYSNRYRKIYMAHEYQPDPDDLYFRPITLDRPTYRAVLCWNTEAYVVRCDMPPPIQTTGTPYHVAAGERHAV